MNILVFCETLVLHFTPNILKLKLERLYNKDISYYKKFFQYAGRGRQGADAVSFTSVIVDSTKAELIVVSFLPIFSSNFLDYCYY